MYRSNIDNLWW